MSRLKQSLLLATLFSALSMNVAYGQDYYRARRYQQDAESYMRKAEANRREAEDYKRKAESYQREALYYTRQGRDSEAKQYTRKAEQALNDYNAQLRNARQNDSRAADCFRSAANALR